MKKMIIILYLITVSFPVPAQNFQEWWQQKKTKKQYLAEQILALHAYGTVLKKGYEVTTQGLGLLHTIQSGDFVQHETYFSSFSAVNPQIKNHPEAEKTIALYSQIRQLTLRIPSRLFLENRFTAPEEKVIRHVILSINNDCDQMLLDLQALLEKDQLNLSDSEGISQLEQIHDRMQEVYSYTIRFYQTCQNLSIARQKEYRAIEKRKNIFFSNQD